MEKWSRYKVIHQTEYQYENEASLCHNVMYKTPMDTPFQKVISFECEIDPKPSYFGKRKDFFGNESIYFSVDTLHKTLRVKAESEVSIQNPDWLTVGLNDSKPWEEVVRWTHSAATTNDIKQFYLESEHVPILPEIQRYALQSFKPNRPIFEALKELNSRIFSDFKFTPGFTDISTPVKTVYETKKGVCQDFAHFGLSCLRSLGLSAKYMSGYLETVPPPGKPKMIGADASHAWIAVYIPEWGWVEFDSTNNLIVKNEHIRVATGRDFSDVTPLKGIVYSSGEQQLKVSVDVTKLQ